MDYNKYLNVFDQIPQYQYCQDIVGLIMGAFIKYVHNEIFDNHQ